MTNASVSLIIVSRHRTQSLLRTIKAVLLQDYEMLELVVVADPVAAVAVQAQRLPIKVVPFEQANISSARNAGIIIAAGDLLTFLDDDAIPEPTWISRLIAPFVNPDVHAATGFVRGRNGISDQWRACVVDPCGWDQAISVDRTCVTLQAGTPQRAIKVQGTNAAFRRTDLQALGGFDPAFRFFLDDADISLRLATLGGLTAIVPDAVVQHGYAASVQRRADRVPKGLNDIAASAACFLRRHAPGTDLDAQRTIWRHAQRQRLLRHLVQGRLEPRDIGRLLSSFDQGWAEGQIRDLSPMSPWPDTNRRFLQLKTVARDGVLLAGRWWQRRRLMRKAEQAVAKGRIVTILCLSPSTWYHRHSFESGGFWIQQGGVFGKSLRDQPMMRKVSYNQRLQEETARISKTRPVS